MVVRAVLGAAALLALSAGLAAATPAAIERGANVHSGPGAKYRVVARLPRGSVVDVDGCTRAWCEVVWRGRHGYVAHSQLAGMRAPAAVAVAPGPAYYDDYPGFDYPGYAYAPMMGVEVAPRWHNYRGRWWHHRRGGNGWSGRQPLPTGSLGPRQQSGMPAQAVPAGGSKGVSTFGSSVVGSSMNAPAGVAAAPPPVSGPAVSTPPVSSPPGSAGRQN